MAAANMARTRTPLVIAIQNSRRLNTKSFAKSSAATGSVANASQTRGPPARRRIGASIRAQKRKRAARRRPVIARVSESLVVTSLCRAAVALGLEGLSAAAGRHRVRVAEGEAAAHEGVDEVHLGSLEVHRAHGVDDDAHTFVLRDAVAFLDRVREGHAVAEARAAARRDVHAQSEILPILLSQDLLQLARRAWRQRDELGSGLDRQVPVTSFCIDYT